MNVEPEAETYTVTGLTRVSIIYFTLINLFRTEKTDQTENRQSYLVQAILVKYIAKKINCLRPALEVCQRNDIRLKS